MDIDREAFDAIMSWYEKPIYPFDWSLEIGDIINVIRMTPNSTPGPDEVPLIAFRMIPRIASAIFYEAIIHFLSCAEAGIVLSLPSFINRFSDCLLSKKPTGSQEPYGEFYEVNGTRAISIGTTMNRLIASVLRNRIASCAGVFCHEAQQGFIPGRSINKLVCSVLDIFYDHVSSSTFFCFLFIRLFVSILLSGMGLFVPSS